MHTALRHPERVTVDEVAETFGISRHHLVKVVHDLGRSGYLETQPRDWRRLHADAKPPEEIRLGDIVRLGEESGNGDCLSWTGAVARVPAPALLPLERRVGRGGGGVLLRCWMATRWPISSSNRPGCARCWDCELYPGGGQLAGDPAQFTRPNTPLCQDPEDAVLCPCRFWSRPAGRDCASNFEIMPDTRPTDARPRNLSLRWCITSLASETVHSGCGRTTS
jgi:hypothetical protein